MPKQLCSNHQNYLNANFRRLIKEEFFFFIFFNYIFEKKILIKNKKKHYECKIIIKSNSFEAIFFVFVNLTLFDFFLLVYDKNRVNLYCRNLAWTILIQ